MPRPQPQVWWVSSGLGAATRGDRVSRERTGCPGQEERTVCQQTIGRRVRLVDQKPTLHMVWGIGPEFKSVEALGLENLMPVSV
jgi:hypothetical protein